MKIAIIGAGLSGITAATELSKVGHDVTVYEKNDYVGGKCQTVNLGEDQIEVGAIILTGSHTYLIDIARRLGVSLTHDLSSTYKVDEDGITDLSAELKSIPFNFLKWIYHTLLYTYHYLFPTNKFLNTSLSEYVRNSKFLSFMFDNFIFNLGYSSNFDIKLFQVFKIFSPIAFLTYYLVILFNNIMLFAMFKNGYQNMIEKMANGLKINLNTEVTSIGTSLSNTSNKDQVVINNVNYDKVIVTVNPKTIKHLLPSSFGDIADNISFSPYCTIIASFSNLMPNSIYMIKKDAKNSLIKTKLVLVRSIDNQSVKKETDKYICYLHCQENSTFEEVKEIFKQDCKKFHFELKEIYTCKIWSNYYPHFNSTESQEKFESIQGINNIYFTGSIGSYESTEASVQYTLEVLKRHFGINTQISTIDKLKGIWYLINKG